MSNNIKCRAKNPSTCPHHGSPQQNMTMTDKINNLFTLKQPVFYPTFGETGKQVGSTIIIKPNASNTKTKPIAFTVDAENYSKLTEKVEQKLAELELKEYKTGWSAEAFLSTADDGNGVSVKHYVSTSPDPFADESVTETGVAGMKQALVAEFRNQGESQENFTETINTIKDTKIARSPAGAKAIAIVEAMNTFKYFHLNKGRGNYDVSAAFESILGKTSEYTNRGWNIRVYMDYKPNGEVSKAFFSLDEKYGPFKQKQVDYVNEKLKKHIDSF